jgi:hypothetical protein
MIARTLPLSFLVASLAVLSVGGATLQHEGHEVGKEVEENENVQQGILDSMSRGRMDHGPHMRMTQLRPSNREDDARAREILEKLRATLAAYGDDKAARRDGYRPLLPGLQQREYHFTNRRRTAAANREFDPSVPSSLLYEKKGNEWKLVGAMYTAARGATEEELDARVPLSVARWHVHVNICIPPLAKLGKLDWSRFGPKGSIATREECSEAEGYFLPQVLGWMVHVYPFEDDPAEIWGN